MAATEFELSERYFTGLDRGESVDLGLGDDAALVHAEGGLAMCLDTLVEGVHFPVDAPPETVGHKALAVNLSDLAAMGAQPLWALLGLTLPASDSDWVAGFAEGLRSLAEGAGVRLIGGDTTRGPRTISVQVTGRVAPEQALRRCGARAGDAIYVSGWPGEAAQGLRQWQSGVRRGPLVERLHRPTPRLELGLALRGLATAAIDVSDGLVADLMHLARASRVGAVLEAERLPISEPLLAELGREEAEVLALSGGDDYELCFTVPAGGEAQVQMLSRQLALPLTRIGRIEAAPGVTVLREGAGISLPRAGYQHFVDGGRRR